MKRQAFAALGALSLAACTAATNTPPSVSSAAPATATRIVDSAAAARLRANKGVTLQWIGWNDHGTASVTDIAGTLTLRGAQAQPNGPGRLYLDGTVTEIGTDYFVFDGTIRITDTPDAGRRCEANKVWHFAVTQNRPYWRLREFEWCDGLTDYVDIYF